jgi:hypothetical protein
MGVDARAVCLTWRLLAVGMLAGCTSQAAWWTFEKPEMTELQLQLDQNECFSQSIDGTSPDNVGGGLVRINRDTYRRCMEERGYVARVSAN